MKPIRFSVDSALIRELGERLVGRPEVALAELIKNSYDADARKVELEFFADRMEIRDNGHGMSFNEFRDFWMRIGTPHKQSKQLSRELRRPLTGSKGIGRLSVQFLAKSLEMFTVADSRETVELHASVNWDETVAVGDLTNATALYEETERKTSFPDNVRHGTVIVLSRLNHSWDTAALTGLAKEIWTLRAPFRASPRLKTVDQRSFDIVATSENAALAEAFQQQLEVPLGLWHARLVGQLRQGKKQNAGILKASLEYAGEPPIAFEYSLEKCHLEFLDFELRIFAPAYRQRYGVKVGDLREYLNAFGGVHVYDNGFRLPYYGTETDWLRIEADASHRLSRSKLLPESLQFADGLQHLPYNARIFGVVNVSTSTQSSKGEDSFEKLTIQVTRDRLVDNKAFQDLRWFVRYALDYYAMQEARRAFEDATLYRPEPSDKPPTINSLKETLESHRPEIPAPVFEKLADQVETLESTSKADADILSRQVALLGPLATAGISALAYDHEVSKQLHILEEVSAQMRRLATRPGAGSDKLSELAEQLERWTQRARATRALFSHLLDEESRETVAALRAQPTLAEVKKQLGVLAREVNIDLSQVEQTIRLPPGRWAEWTAIFQNVFLNAVNAMIDSPRRLIRVRSVSSGARRALLIEDTGTGVDLATAEELFQPFVRKTRISQERRALGAGGMGLGLTIVRMIATNLSCTVGFEESSPGFSTAFALRWSEGHA